MLLNLPLLALGCMALLLIIGIAGTIERRIFRSPTSDAAYGCGRLLALILLAFIVAVGIPVVLLVIPIWVVIAAVTETYHWVRWRIWGIPHPGRWERELQADRWFWSVIEADGVTIRDDPESHLEAIRNNLLRQALRPSWASPDFQQILERKLAEACTWDLRGASFLINGRDTEEAFANFRAWLIARGESIYRGALLDADSLADVVEPYGEECQLPGLRSVAGDVDRMIDWRASFDKKPRRNAPTGEPMDFGDAGQLSRRLPRLTTIYLS